MFEIFTLKVRFLATVCIPIVSTPGASQAKVLPFEELTATSVYCPALPLAVIVTGEPLVDDAGMLTLSEGVPAVLASDSPPLPTQARMNTNALAEAR